MLRKPAYCFVSGVFGKMKNSSESFDDFTVSKGNSSMHRLVITLTALLALGSTVAASAQQTSQSIWGGQNAYTYSKVTLPLVTGWYEGKPALYISTETSDRRVAAMTNITYSPVLRKAIAGGAVDDIYMVTNFKQGNVIPEAPDPEGPRSRAHKYTPLWQLSLVTWKANVRPHILKSEDAILSEQARGNVKIEKTDIVINCPIIYTPEGGLFPGAHLDR